MFFLVIILLEVKTELGVDKAKRNLTLSSNEQQKQPCEINLTQLIHTRSKLSTSETEKKNINSLNNKLI